MYYWLEESRPALAHADRHARGDSPKKRERQGDCNSKESCQQAQAHVGPIFQLQAGEEGLSPRHAVKDAKDQQRREEKG